MSRRIIKARAAVSVTRESPSTLLWAPCKRPESEQVGPHADLRRFKVKST
jgi:hypothetical protein